MILAGWIELRLSRSMRKEGFPLLTTVLFLAALIGCGEPAGDASFDEVWNALNAAGLELRQAGFDEQALELLEEACLGSPSLSTAGSIAKLLVRRGDASAAAAFLERIFPSTRPAGLDDLIADLYLEGWRWQKARGFLEAAGDPRRLRVEDLLSRGKRIHEPFNHSFHLSWKRRGCRAGPMGECLLLSPLPDPGLRRSAFNFSTPLGWNGKDFRMSMEMQLLDPTPGTRFAWGLASPGTADGTAQDDPFQMLLMEYQEGEVSLRCGRNGAETKVQAALPWHMPSGRWLSVSIEYIADMEALFPSEAGKQGMVRLLLRDRDQDFLWVKLELAPEVPFSGGHMLAGFFQPAGQHPGSRNPELYIKDFLFEN
jgi:hypothetical protein